MKKKKARKKKKKKVPKSEANKEMGKHGHKRKRPMKKTAEADCYIADLPSARQWLAVQRASKRNVSHSNVVALCSDDNPMMQSNLI